MFRLLHVFLLSMALVLGLGAVLQLGYGLLQHIEPVNRRPGDVYDPSLARLNTLDRLETFVDSLARAQQLTPDSLPAYINLADSVVRMRFYHGLQNYRFADNWLANVLGKYVWFHLGAKVIPDDILQGQKAFCSQSSIVFQELLKRKGFDVRSVLLPGHFCTEVSIGGQWQFHDVSYKPSFLGLPALSAQDLMDNPGYIRQAYLYSFADNFLANYQQHFDAQLVRYGQVNAFAAPNMLLFHRITHFVSLWGWVVCLALAWSVHRLHHGVWMRRKLMPTRNPRPIWVEALRE